MRPSVRDLIRFLETWIFLKNYQRHAIVALWALAQVASWTASASTNDNWKILALTHHKKDLIFFFFWRFSCNKRQILTLQSKLETKSLFSKCLCRKEGKLNTKRRVFFIIYESGRLQIKRTASGLTITLQIFFSFYFFLITENFNIT